MTDEEAIEILRGCELNGCVTEDREATGMAINIMHKYQKIKQILKEHDNDRTPEDYWYIDKIREVVEK